MKGRKGKLTLLDSQHDVVAGAAVEVGMEVEGAFSLFRGEVAQAAEVMMAISLHMFHTQGSHQGEILLKCANRQVGKVFPRLKKLTVGLVT